MFFGKTSFVEPAGALALDFAVPTPADCPLDLLPDPPCGHGGMLIVMSSRCLASRTVRTPGVCSAIETGSVAAELLLELELLPQPPSTTAPAANATSATVRTTDLLHPGIKLSPSSSPTRSTRPYPNGRGAEPGPAVVESTPRPDSRRSR